MIKQLYDRYVSNFYKTEFLLTFFFLTSLLLYCILHSEIESEHLKGKAIALVLNRLQNSLVINLKHFEHGNKHSQIH